MTDSGTGMTPEVNERAFEPFFTTKADRNGTGLGLSMVYGFVKQSNGHIKIYSEPGHGTTIKLYFPRLTGQTDKPRWTGHERRRRKRRSSDGTETVLLVEDDPRSQVRRWRCCSERGYQVLSPPDGSATLAAGRDPTPHRRCFTDVVLPGGLTGAS